MVTQGCARARCPCWGRPSCAGDWMCSPPKQPTHHKAPNRTAEAIPSRCPVVLLFSPSLDHGEIAFLNQSQHHRMVGVGRDLCGSPSPTPCRSRVAYSRLHRTLSRRVWNISREGDSTTSLGSMITRTGNPVPRFLHRAHKSSELCQLFPKGTDLSLRCGGGKDVVCSGEAPSARHPASGLRSTRQPPGPC